MQELVFLKLGGSLITDKTKPYTPRLNKLADLADQIALSLRSSPNLKLILGHGSGSFGHTPAKKHGTIGGVNTPNEWAGFVEVWYHASALNRFVLQALREANLSAMTFSPAASVWANNRQIINWDTSKINKALDEGIIPVVHGDVIFDETKGGTILSTEDLFVHLAHELKPTRILLAGLEEAIYADFPERKHRVQVLTRKKLTSMINNVGPASGVDVTGGMQSKVEQMVELAEALPDLSIQIFSGDRPKNVLNSLQGEQLGTLITINEN
ncbi:MAG: isopentenyl phosphate kinase [Anaerolineae bacterium]|nr:isopentenyl phosphate kinase [Anaerolineae bacterium]